MLTDPTAEKLDCHARVVTPENIAFEYALAGPFQRLPAYLLDIFIRSLAFFLLVTAMGFLLALVGIGGATGPIFAFLVLVGYFLVSWFYGIYFETYFNGRTPGKMLMKLRVIGIDGRPINGVQAALRNLLRVADTSVMLSLQMFDESMPPAYMIPTMSVGLVTMVFTKRLQRIGDLAAGTMVVSEKRKVTPLNQPPDDLRAFGLAELIPPSFEMGSSLAQAVGQYMETRKRLSLRRREEIAGRVAGPLIRKFELLPDTSADLLMCALYVQTYLTESQKSQGVKEMRSRMRTLRQSVQSPTMVTADVAAGKGPSPQASPARDTVTATSNDS